MFGPGPVTVDWMAASARALLPRVAKLELYSCIRHWQWQNGKVPRYERVASEEEGIIVDFTNESSGENISQGRGKKKDASVTVHAT